MMSRKFNRHAILESENEMEYKQKPETHHQKFIHARLDIPGKAPVTIKGKFANEHDAKLAVLMEMVRREHQGLFTTFERYLEKVVVE